MIRLRDLDASLRFHTNLLRMKLLHKRDYPGGKFTLAFVGYSDESSNTVIELTHNWDQADPYNLGSGFGHLALGVPDVYEACERFAAAGVKIPRPVVRWRKAGRSLPLSRIRTAIGSSWSSALSLRSAFPACCRRGERAGVRTAAQPAHNGARRNP